MARVRHARSDEPKPEPLPPERRTVGQLVAESFHAYGSNVGFALLLGVPVAVMQQVFLARTDTEVGTRSVAAAENRWLAVILLVAFAPLFSVAYALATRRMTKVSVDVRTMLKAIVAGTVAFVPAAVLFGTFALAAAAWLALVGLVVPVVVVERSRLDTAFRRAVTLARADYIHALGSLATLMLIFAFVRIGMAVVLRDQADNTLRVAVFLTDLVLSPLLFLGAAILYVDQEARHRLRPTPDERAS